MALRPWARCMPSADHTPLRKHRQMIPWKYLAPSLHRRDVEKHRQCPQGALPLSLEIRVQFLVLRFSCLSDIRTYMIRKMGSSGHSSGAHIEEVVLDLTWASLNHTPLPMHTHKGPSGRQWLAECTAPRSRSQSSAKEKGSWHGLLMWKPLSPLNLTGSPSPRHNPGEPVTERKTAQPSWAEMRSCLQGSSSPQPELLRP